MVAIPALVVFAAAWRPTREPPAVRWSRASVALWLGVVVVTVGWELLAYFSSPREDHPTLSVIADEIMSVHPGRALLFVLWLALGWLFVRSPRSAALVTSRTITFVGYGLILASIILLATVATRRPTWMTMPDALERAHAAEDRADLGGRRLDVARLAPVRQGQRRVPMTRRPSSVSGCTALPAPIGSGRRNGASTTAGRVPIAAVWEVPPVCRSLWAFLSGSSPSGSGPAGCSGSSKGHASLSSSQFHTEACVDSGSRSRPSNSSKSVPAPSVRLPERLASRHRAQR